MYFGYPFCYIDNGIKIDLVLISHFHNDHCGALPYLTEQFGYDGKVIMTHPTKAIIPIMLEDGRKIEEREGKKSSQNKQNTNQSKMFSNTKSQHIFKSMSQGSNLPHMSKSMNQIPGMGLSTNIIDYDMQEEQDEEEKSMFEASTLTKEMIAKCIRKYNTIQLHETMEVSGI